MRKSYVYYYDLELLELTGILKLKFRLKQQVDKLRRILTGQILEFIALGSGMRLSSVSLEETKEKIKLRDEILKSYGETKELKNNIQEFNRILLFDLCGHAKLIIAQHNRDRQMTNTSSPIDTKQRANQKIIELKETYDLNDPFVIELINVIEALVKDVK